MPQCQAFGCNNKPHLCKGKTFFKIPNGKLNPELRDISGKWLSYIGTGHSVDKFKFDNYKQVCEDHFTPDCFVEDEHIKMCMLMGETPRYKKLHQQAIPSIFIHKRPKKDYGRGDRVANRDAKKQAKVSDI